MRQRENFYHLLDYNLASRRRGFPCIIRNLCSAISVVCSNLSRRVELRNNVDFDALNRLVQALSRLASFELRHKAGNVVPRCDIRIRPRTSFASSLNRTGRN